MSIFKGILGISHAFEGSVIGVVVHMGGHEVRLEKECARINLLDGASTISNLDLPIWPLHLREKYLRSTGSTYPSPSK